MLDRKTTVQRSEHLRVDKFFSFMSVVIYIWTLIAPPLLFQFAKRNKKVMPHLYILNFTSNQPPPPPVFLSFSPMHPASNFPGNYCTVPNRDRDWKNANSLFKRGFRGRRRRGILNSLLTRLQKGHKIGPWRGIISGCMFFCLQVDRPITGRACKWQFTVNRSLGNVCAKYTKRKNCYTICQTVYWALWWQNDDNIKFLLTFLPRLHTQLNLSQNNK